MLLAIDTSTSSVGIAIFDGSTILGEIHGQHESSYNNPCQSSKTDVEDIELTIRIERNRVCLRAGSITSLLSRLVFCKRHGSWFGDTGHRNSNI